MERMLTSLLKLGLLAATLLVVAGAAHAQECSIADLRASLTQAVKRDCLRDRKGSESAGICACEASERIARLSDSEVMRLMRGTDSDRANMMPKLRKDSAQAVHQCIARRLYPICVKDHADLPRRKAEAYCTCLTGRYAKKSNFPDVSMVEADRAYCTKIATGFAD